MEDLNPNIKEVLQPGDVLNVPNIANNEEKAATEEFNYYEVLPKEGFYRLKVKSVGNFKTIPFFKPDSTSPGLRFSISFWDKPNFTLSL